MPTTARVARIHEYGPPEVLRFEDIVVGEPGEDEALIRNTVIGLNFSESPAGRSKRMGRAVSTRDGTTFRVILGSFPAPSTLATMGRWPPTGRTDTRHTPRGRSPLGHPTPRRGGCAERVAGRCSSRGRTGQRWIRRVRTHGSRQAGLRPNDHQHSWEIYGGAGSFIRTRRQRRSAPPRAVGVHHGLRDFRSNAQPGRG